MGKIREHTNQMREKSVEPQKSGNLPFGKYLRNTWEKQLTGTVINLPGRGLMFIFPPHTARWIREDHCWRITEESSILGSSGFQNKH